LYDDQFSLTTTPLALEQRHQAFIQPDNTTAHQGLLREQFTPPIPLAVLGAAQGRGYTEEELSRKFDHHLFPRRTHQYGCVTLHSYHVAIEEGLPRTQVWLWVSGEQLRAVFEHVVLAEYRCHDDCRARKVTDIREGMFYPTRFASPQGTLLPLTPQACMVVYRARSSRRRARRLSPAQQLWLFEGCLRDESALRLTDVQEMLIRIMPGTLVQNRSRSVGFIPHRGKGRPGHVWSVRWRGSP
jgi:hypothetical protein